MITQADLEERAEQDQKLYERFAESLEPEHEGEYVAISEDGRLIVDIDSVRALERAIAEFGSGNFAFRKIGSRALGRWRTRLGY